MQAFQILTFFSAFTMISLSRTLTKLETNSTLNNIFTSDDILLSSLGHCQLTLVTSSCTLQLKTFDSTSLKYILSSSFKPKEYQSNSCLSLSLNKNGTLVDNNNVVYLQNMNIAFMYSYYSLTVDDVGVVRILAYKKVNTQSNSNGYYNDELAQSVIEEYTQLSIGNKNRQIITFNNGKFPSDIIQRVNSNNGNNVKNNASSLKLINLNNWQFTLTSIQLKLQSLQSKSSQFQFTFTFLPNGEVTFKPEGLYDQLNNTYPYVIFDYVNYYGERCTSPFTTISTYYTIQVHQFWPIITIYNDQAHILMQFNPISQLYRQQLYLNTYHQQVCPMHLFQYRGQCLLACPSPYYGQVRQAHGHCVLKCQAGYIVDLSTNICTCNSVAVINQPSMQTYCLDASSIPYYFGCYCTSALFFDSIALKCVGSCSVGYYGWNGVCVRCGYKCLSCELDRSNKFRWIGCLSCEAGYKIANGVCVLILTNSTALGLNCLTSSLIHCKSCTSSNQCNACSLLYSLQNGTCVETCNTTYPYVTSNNKYQTQCNSIIASNCPSNCLMCRTYKSSSICLACPMNHILYISAMQVTCRLNTILLECSQSSLYLYSAFQNACYNANYKETMINCLQNVANCQICFNNSTNVCVLCNVGYYLYNVTNSCVTTCPNGYFAYFGACIASINNCKVHGFKKVIYDSSSEQIVMNLHVINSSTAYHHYIDDGFQPARQYIGYNTYAKYYHMQQQQSLSINRVPLFFEYLLTCQECNDGYGLVSDQQDGLVSAQGSSYCTACPIGCSICYYSNTCLVSNQSPVTNLQVVANINKCSTFIAESGQYTCQLSCDSSTYPTLNPYFNKIFCTSNTSTAVQDYIRVDGSSFRQSNGTYVYMFVMSEPLSVKNKITRLLLSGAGLNGVSGAGLNGVNLTNKSLITVASSDRIGILNLSGLLADVSSQNNLYFVNSIYGINSEQSFNSYIQSYLAYIGYILSLVIFFMYCIYVGNGIMYKMDNFIIFCQTIYYFLFVRLLLANPIAQFYYGWSFMHCNFYPNYFAIPDDYIESQAPLSYALACLDANIIRNCGGTISLLLTFIPLVIVISVVIYVMDVYWGRHELFYTKMVKNITISCIQFLSYNIFYWCIANIEYSSDSNVNMSFHNWSNAVSIFLLLLIIIYTVFRMYFHVLAGMYMVKRIIFASVLAESYSNIGYLAIIIVMEGLFTVGRLLVEQPQTKRDRLIVLLQEFSLVIAYIILYSATNGSAVAILITFYIYGMVLLYASDLIDLYIASKNSYFIIQWMNSLLFRSNNSPKDISDIFNKAQYSNKERQPQDCQDYNMEPVPTNRAFHLRYG